MTGMISLLCKIGIERDPAHILGEQFLYDGVPFVPYPNPDSSHDPMDL